MQCQVETITDCPTTLEGYAIPYLFHSWQAHIKAKRQQLNLRVHKHCWLIGRTSRLPAENKLLLYKTTLKPIWTDGTELWGCSKTV